MNSEGRKIFYTDDDVDDRDIFIDAARHVSESLQVTTQRDGDELIGLLKNPHTFPDLIFLDLNMPIKNGYEVLQQIKQSEPTKNLPIIVFSTSDDANAIKTSRELGANLYIPKPSSFSALKKAITYTLTIDWDTFNPLTDNFLYRAGQ